MKNNFFNYSVANIYSKPSSKSEVISQILYGEKFKIIKKKKDWYKIRNNYDNYIGFIKKRKFNQKFQPTNKIYKLKSKIYKKKNNKFISTNNFLYFASGICVKKRHKNFIEFEKNKWLKINDTKTLVWKGQYVQKAEATFYQILAMGRLPFHFYIKLDTADNAHALNMEKFNRRIELAVNEVKKDLATQYNLTISQIDQIIEQNDMLAAYGESVPTNTQFNESEQKKIQLYESLKASIGNENFEQLKTNSNTILQDELNKAIDNEVQFAIDETIRDAINSGIEAAALEAGLAALINALMQGASWADALKAGEQACTGHGGC